MCLSLRGLGNATRIILRTLLFKATEAWFTTNPFARTSFGS